LGIQACFLTAISLTGQQCLEYLACLKQAADQYGCKVHAYALMTNHVHLLLTPENLQSMGQLFQGLGQYYVRYFNATYQHHDNLWEGRYIELNPVRAGIVDQPCKYRWSGYAENALGASNAILTAHEEYIGFGKRQLSGVV